MRTLYIAFCVGCVAINLVAEPFRNLGFEDAQTNSIRSNFGSVTGPVNELLPGWNLLYNDQQVSTMGFNSTQIGLDGSLPALFNHRSDLATAFPPDGTYGFALSFSGSGAFTLSQRGDIPVGSRFLFYKARNTGPGVAIDGKPLQLLQGLFPIDECPRNLWFDISEYAGKTVDLQFFLAQNPPGGRTEFLDSIGFSNVPEPSTVAILVCGGALLFVGYKKRH